MNISFDLFLLMFNLSQLHNREKIINLFLEGMQEIFKPIVFTYFREGIHEAQSKFEIRTGESFFGIVTAVGPESDDTTHRILMVNSIQMLAVILQRLEFEQKLEKERDGFEKISIKKFKEVEKNIKDLEEVKSASLNLIEDLSDEIEKRKVAESIIKESEEKFRNLFENSPVGKSITGTDGSINVNSAFCKVLGYSADELKAKNWKDISHPDDIEASDKFVQSLLRGETSTVKFEKRYLHKNGDTIYTDVSTYLQRDNDGKPAYFITSINDITYRKMAEEAVLQEKKFNQAAIDSLPGLFYLFDEQGHYLRWNKNYEEVSGYSADEISKMSPLDYFTEPDKGNIAAAINKVWTTGNVFVEGRFTSKNRTQNHYFFTGKLFWFDGKRCLIGMGIDINERKQIEVKLSESEERFRLAMKASNDGLYDWNLETNSIYYSPGWKKMLGYEDHELPNDFSVWEKTTEENDVKKSWELQQKLISKQIDRFVLEFKMKHKDGHWVDILSKAEAIFNDIEKAVRIVGTHTDITVSKNAESQIRMLNEELEEKVNQRTAQLVASNKELEAFSYSVSHDLRAPLRAIHSFTKILKEDYANVLDDEGKRICGVIEAGSVRMGNLIDDLLAFSRIGRIELQASIIDMTLLAESIFYEITSPDEKKRIIFKVEKLPPAYGDAATLKQVMVNLIGNSIKYTSKTEKPEIIIGSESGSEYFTYFVKDNGVGFDMKYLNMMFGVFQRLHSSKEFEGNGVGLAIVQRIIHKHKGKVWAEGEVGKGATFYFTLPVKDKKQR